MNGKLIKTEVNYLLEDKKGVVIASTSLKGDGLSLSLKNCQAIERGYDLNELGMDYASTIYDGRTELTRFNGAKVDFIKGFQKALELMGDKMFSEDDMIRFMQFIISQETLDNASSVSTVTAKYYLDNFQSLQQTEWDVEIVTENVCGRCYSNNTNECWSTKECSDGKYDYPKPLLDADGCLILKRSKSE